jgi:hypothetical protein
MPDEDSIHHARSSTIRSITGLAGFFIFQCGRSHSAGSANRRLRVARFHGQDHFEDRVATVALPSNISGPSGAASWSPVIEAEY